MGVAAIVLFQPNGVLFQRSVPLSTSLFYRAVISLLDSPKCFWSGLLFVILSSKSFLMVKHET